MNLRLPLLPSAETVLDSQQILLNFVDYVLYCLRAMKTKSKVIQALHAQAIADAKDLKRIYREQQRLRTAYNQWRELDRQARERHERFRRLMILILEHEPGKGILTIMDKANDLGIATPQTGEKPAVWEAVLELVRQFPDSQVIDLLEWLATDLGMVVSRQSFDSAIAAHRELFKTRRQGKGKYISLRDERMVQDAPATKPERK